MKFTEAQILKSAAAIANARGARRAVPAITNVLDVLPGDLKAAVIEDATAALEAIEPLEAVRAAAEQIQRKKEKGN